MRYAKVDRCPEDGRLINPYAGRLWFLKFRRCDSCDVLVLPHCTKWLDPAWLRLEIRDRLERV
jgi:hypothetical protein